VSVEAICEPDPPRAQWGVLRRRLLVIAALSLAPWLASCAPSGEDPASRLTWYGPETGEYRVGYLEPPWGLVDASGTSAFLRIESTLMATAGLDAGEGKFELNVTVEPGAPTERIERELASARARGEAILFGPRAVTLADGASGLELLTRRSDPIERYFRVVVAAVDGGRVVRLAFAATPPLDTAEVDAMIAQVEIGPER